MLIIGLTGGIAAGKTTVANMFKKRGARIIDADRIGHRIMKPKTEIWQKIVGSFGKEILNKNLTINRKKLGRIVFSSPRLLKKLNKIVHPAMTKVIKNEIAKLTTSPSDHPTNMLILDAALLFRANWSSLVDKVILVKANRQNQIKRLKKYKNLSIEEARQRIASQVSLRKMKRADYLIDNNASLRETEEKVEEIFNKCRFDFFNLPTKPPTVKNT